MNISKNVTILQTALAPLRKIHLEPNTALCAIHRSLHRRRCRRRLHQSLDLHPTQSSLRLPYTQSFCRCRPPLFNLTHNQRPSNRHQPRFRHRPPPALHSGVRFLGYHRLLLSGLALRQAPRRSHHHSTQLGKNTLHLEIVILKHPQPGVFLYLTSPLALSLNRLPSSHSRCPTSSPPHTDSVPSINSDYRCKNSPWNSPTHSPRSHQPPDG